MAFRLATVGENTRNALMECGRSSYRLDLPARHNSGMRRNRKAVAAATALQGAFGTAIFMIAPKCRLQTRLVECLVLEDWPIRLFGPRTAKYLNVVWNNPVTLSVRAAWE
jgi:uroporphyrinogen-III synthase